MGLSYEIEKSFRNDKTTKWVGRRQELGHKKNSWTVVHVKLRSIFSTELLLLHGPKLIKWCVTIPLKGQCHEIFCFWFFSWISFPPAPEYPIRTVSNFFENSRRYSQVKVHHRYQRHRWQNCRRPVSMTPVANCHRYQQWEQYQAADTLKWTWRQKCIYMLSLLSKGVPTKLLKCFWLKIFFICHRCQRHQWSTLSCDYLREIWGKLIHEKNQKSKISWHCPFDSQQIKWLFLNGYMNVC